MALSQLDREVLITVLGPRFPMVVERIVTRAKATLDEYEDISAEEIGDGIIADLQRGLAAMLEERALTDEDRAGLGEIGDTRARQGIPLEAMLQVYRFTVDEVFSGLWEAADEGALDHAQAGRLARLIWQYADPMMDVAIQAYRRRELQLAVAESQGRTALVHRLLLTPDGAEHLDPVAGAALDQSASYVAIRARTLGDIRDLLLELGTPGVLDGGAVALHEGDVIGFALRRPATTPSPAGTVVGVGPAGPLRDLPHSLAVATRALETAVAFGKHGIRSIDELAFEAIARSEATIGAHLAARYITPCQPQTSAGAELVDTIRSLLAHDLGVEQAAAALFVHPNTVRNRLRRYEQLTGASLRRVDDVSALRLALLRAELS